MKRIVKTTEEKKTIQNFLTLYISKLIFTYRGALNLKSLLFTYINHQITSHHFTGLNKLKIF